MKNLSTRYKKHFTDKSFVLSVLIGFAVLILSLVVNFYAGTYATEKASSAVTDIILSNISVYDVDIIFIYGPVVLWAFVAVLGLLEPKRIPFILKSIALFLIVRSVFVTLTHIGPFPDQLNLNNPLGWIRDFSFGGDLFFSAHTGLPYLMALIFWEHKILRVIFIISSVFFGIIVLLGHFHYSIDVFSAFFITYSIYKIAEKIFKKDKAFFDENYI